MVRDAYGREVRLTVREWIALLRSGDIGAQRIARRGTRN